MTARGFAYSGATAAQGRFPYPHRSLGEIDHGISPSGAASRLTHRCPICQHKAKGIYCGLTSCAREQKPPTAINPPFNRWVLAYWPHMVHTGGTLSRFKGWFRSRRTDRGWQAQFGSYRANLRNSIPAAWKELEA